MALEHGWAFIFCSSYHVRLYYIQLRLVMAYGFWPFLEHTFYNTLWATQSLVAHIQNDISSFLWDWWINRDLRRNSLNNCEMFIPFSTFTQVCQVEPQNMGAYRNSRDCNMMNLAITLIQVTNIQNKIEFEVESRLCMFTRLERVALWKNVWSSVAITSPTIETRILFLR